VVFCATALPWYVLCAIRNPDFLRIFIWQHNFQRYLTPDFEHRQPFWFFGGILLLAILPWLPVLFTVATDAGTHFRSSERKNSPALFVAGWALFPLLFFSLSQSKLPGYILPAIPAVLLLLVVSVARSVARSVGRHVPKESGSLSFIVLGSGLTFPAGIALALAEWSHARSLGALLQANITRGFEVALGVAIVCLVLIAGFLIRRHLGVAICGIACTAGILILLANRLILPEFDTVITARPAAVSAIRGYGIRPDEAFVYRIPRAYEYGLDYYFNADLSEWTAESTNARILFATRESLDSPPLNGLPGKSEIPATADGKIIVVFLDRPAEK
jgi:4-amino-4-deoxy-L-arabinose transferase-like glycosyltransferase